MRGSCLGVSLFTSSLKEVLFCDIVLTYFVTMNHVPIRKEVSMLTIEKLREFGAAVDEGLSRCLGNEDFYLKMVNMALQEKSFDKLRDALAEGDKKTAFEAAHSLKGVLGNLALTPLYDPAVEITELLRARKDADYDALLQALLEQKDKLTALCS